MKMLILIVVLSIGFLEAKDGPEAPINVPDITDEASLNQNKKHWKAWRNALATYAEIRKVAFATLEDMKVVGSLGRTTYQMLKAVETFSTNCETLWSKIEKVNNISGAVDIVVFLEEDILQPSDRMYYTTKKSISEKYSAYKDKRIKFFRNSHTYDAFIESKRKLEAVWKPAVKKNIDNLNMPASMGKNPTGNEKKRALSQAIASNTIAQFTNNSVSIEDQQMLLEQKKFKNREMHKEGKVNPLNQALLDRSANRNAYILGLQEHERLSQSINVLSFFLQNQADKVALLGLAQQSTMSSVRRLEIEIEEFTK